MGAAGRERDIGPASLHRRRDHVTTGHRPSPTSHQQILTAAAGAAKSPSVRDRTVAAAGTSDLPRAAERPGRGQGEREDTIDRAAAGPARCNYEESSVVIVSEREKRAASDAWRLTANDGRQSASVVSAHRRVTKCKLPAAQDRIMLIAVR